MIYGPKRQFIARCEQRGYALADVAECIVEDDGEFVTVDETHPKYPLPRPNFSPPATSTTSGPGTELKKMLQKWLGIKATPTCPCNARAKQMDEWGPDECERRIEEILDWLGEEATRRKLPFLRLIAKKMVMLAIMRAKKNQI